MISIVTIPTCTKLPSNRRFFVLLCFPSVAVDLIVTHVQSIFDPSIRHQSIKYYHEDPILNGRLKASSQVTKSAKLASSKAKKKGTSFAISDRYPVEANVMNGKCVTPMINGGFKNGEQHTVKRSAPIGIANGGATSPLLRNGFSSSSAPSHLNGFVNGHDHAQRHHQNGHLNGAIDSGDDSDDSLAVFEQATATSLKSSQSPRKVVPSRPLSLVSPSKAISGGKTATNGGSQSQAQSAAPILLVASR